MDKRVDGVDPHDLAASIMRTGRKTKRRVDMLTLGMFSLAMGLLWVVLFGF